MSLRVGFGFDVHRLDEGYPFFLGGIKISHSKGAVGHSDADVVIHVICDSILGAISEDDIGKHFPDTDNKYKGIDSKRLLSKIIMLLKEKNYIINNIDVTILLERPKLRNYINKMIEILSEIMKINKNESPTDRVNFLSSGHKTLRDWSAQAEPS